MHEVETLPLDLQTHPINLRTKQGTTELHEVRELSGIERDRYLKSVTRRRRSSNDINFENLQADLIVKSLFRVSDGHQYKLEDIAQFPASVQKRLYEIAQKLSALNVEEVAKSKPKGKSETEDDNGSENDSEDDGDSKN